MYLNPDLNFEKLEEYDNHHKVVFLNNPATGLKGFIAIHRRNGEVPSFGATRMWRYRDALDGLRDALRLSRIMSYKAAIAGLPCGGAKGVILSSGKMSVKERKELLRSYVEEVNNLRGEFITGTDVGLFEDDLKLMRDASRFFIGLNGDPAEFTALGIRLAMEVCFEFMTGSSSLDGKSFAIQGLGKIGKMLLGLVYHRAAKVYVADIDKSAVVAIKEKFFKVVVVEPEEIHKQKVDVFSPCALSQPLNQKTITELQCKMIVGGANNQLENDTIGDLLFKNGVLYAPDYVVNAGGLICVYDEYEHPENYSRKRVERKILSIKDVLKKILEESKKRNIAPNRVAGELAEKQLNAIRFRHSAV